MARPKSFIKTIYMDEAGKLHYCQHSRKHAISMGTKRLTLKVDRAKEHFCLECAERFLIQSIEQLQAVLEEVREAKNSADRMQ